MTLWHPEFHLFELLRRPLIGGGASASVIFACIFFYIYIIHISRHTHTGIHTYCVYIYISRHTRTGIYTYMLHTRLFLYIYIYIYINQWYPSTYLYWVNTQKLPAISTSIFGFLVHVVDILQMRTFQRWTAPRLFFPAKSNVTFWVQIVVSTWNLSCHLQLMIQLMSLDDVDVSQMMLNLFECHDSNDTLILCRLNMTQIPRLRSHQPNLFWIVKVCLLRNQSFKTP